MGATWSLNAGADASGWDLLGNTLMAQPQNSYFALGGDGSAVSGMMPVWPPAAGFSREAVKVMESGDIVGQSKGFDVVLNFGLGV
ncbi:hypothetical protein Rcae01_01806 [Novipirellula caenicola]|uniref:Uncharacterized protein n=1 Tax=Novipirellula caenicola TaxID=1536901 RepID=A0ABP9VME4_9BACT